MKKPTGQNQVRDALERGEMLTPLDALRRFDLHHLASTIRVLKAKGLAIEAEMIDTPGGARVARYRLTDHTGGPARGQT